GCPFHPPAQAVAVPGAAGEQAAVRRAHHAPSALGIQRIAVELRRIATPTVKIVPADQQVVELMLQDPEWKPVHGTEAALRVAGMAEEEPRTARIRAALPVRKGGAVPEDDHHMVIARGGIGLILLWQAGPPAIGP